MSNQRVATYVRVSSNLQTAANQVPEVERLAESKGSIIARFSETKSAAKTRPVFDRMLDAARRREFDVLVVWSIDRFGRSLARNVADIRALDEAGVSVVSVREAWLDQGGPARGLLIAVLSWAAEFERARLIERMHASVARRRRAGVRMGRKCKPFDIDTAKRMLGEGLGQRQVAAALGIGQSTLGRALRKAVT